jgi:hypothetical protein
LSKWEDPWEAGLDLAKLRRKAAYFGTIRALAADPRHRGELSPVERQRIARLVDELGQEVLNAACLIDDAVLISEWYLLPLMQRRLGLGHERGLDDLTKAAALARRLHTHLDPIAAEIEHLFQAMPAELRVADDFDVLELKRFVGRFARDAEKTVACLKPAGRPRDARRNVAIVLATWAVEEATGEQVHISRGRSDCPDAHFTNAPGRFVRHFLATLGNWNEPVLVSAFDKLRRKPAATEPLSV